jgi:outer membrane receptor protein involved in Fe transport
VAAYDLTDAIHVYAKYSTGYRAGGANDRSQTFSAFGPEVVKAYEIGAKMDLIDHRVRLNLAGYMMDRTGTQTDFDNVDTISTMASPTRPTTSTPRKPAMRRALRAFAGGSGPDGASGEGLTLARPMPIPTPTFRRRRTRS